MSLDKFLIELKGGAGSGNHGHGGRPGKRGGSTSTGGGGESHPDVITSPAGETYDYRNKAGVTMGDKVRVFKGSKIYHGTVVDMMVGGNIEVRAGNKFIKVNANKKGAVIKV